MLVNGEVTLSTFHIVSQSVLEERDGLCQLSFLYRMQFRESLINPEWWNLVSQTQVIFDLFTTNIFGGLAETQLLSPIVV